MFDMRPLHRGKYRARLVESAEDLADVLALRCSAFHTCDPDSDAFDEVCAHVVVENCETAAIVCCFRMLLLPDGEALSRSYSAQLYDLQPLQRFPDRLVELGRFCIHPAYQNADILRIAWGAITGFVDDHRVKMLFGCSSFPGTKAAEYLDAFAMLKSAHLGPKRWRPRVKSPDVFRYAACVRHKPDRKVAMRHIPPLLRTYLMMGGWVSDHAVIDHQMNTLHVFTGVEVAAIPDARKRLLRAVAG